VFARFNRDYSQISEERSLECGLQDKEKEEEVPKKPK
jgi:hypothetical protein